MQFRKLTVWRHNCAVSSTTVKSKDIVLLAMMGTGARLCSAIDPDVYTNWDLSKVLRQYGVENLVSIHTMLGKLGYVCAKKAASCNTEIRHQKIQLACRQKTTHIKTRLYIRPQSNSQGSYT